MQRELSREEKRSERAVRLHPELRILFSFAEKRLDTLPENPSITQWHKKMFLSRGAVNKIARKARKSFLDHAILLQTMAIIMLIWL